MKQVEHGFDDVGDEVAKPFKYVGDSVKPILRRKGHYGRRAKNAIEKAMGKMEGFLKKLKFWGGGRTRRKRRRKKRRHTRRRRRKSRTRRHRRKKRTHRRRRTLRRRRRRRR